MNKRALSKVLKEGATHLGIIVVATTIAFGLVSWIGLAWALAIFLPILVGLVGYNKYLEAIEDEEMNAWVEKLTAEMECMDCEDEMKATNMDSEDPPLQ